MSLSLEEKIRAVVCNELAVEEGEVTLTARFEEELGADSLDRVSLTMSLEEEFDIEIPDEVAEKLLTFGDVVLFVDAAMTARF